MAHQLKRTVAETFGFDRAPVSPALSEPGCNILRYDTIHSGGFCRIDFTDETVREGKLQVIKGRAVCVRHIALSVKRFLWRHPGFPTIYSEPIGSVGILAEYTSRSEGVSVKICRRPDGCLCVQNDTPPDQTQLAREYFTVLEAAWQKIKVNLTQMTVRLEPTSQGRFLLANHFDENEWNLLVGGDNISSNYEQVAKTSSYLD